MKRSLNDLANIVAGKLSDDNVERVAKSLWFELQKQKKLSRLEELIEKIRQIQAEKNDQLIVEVFSTLELSEHEKEELKEKIIHKTGRQVLMRYSIDSKLLGGLKIKFNDEILDLSWRGKLEKIKQISGR